MNDVPIARFPTLAVRAAALWIALGACFKLFAGSPNDLPPVVRDFSLALPLIADFKPNVGLILRLAIAIELVIVFTALLRPRWAWFWIVVQLGIFIAVLVLTAREAQQTHVEPITFTAALFDPKASCGCFGSSVKTPPGYILVVDSLLLLVVLASRPWRGRLGHLGPEWLPTGAACLALLLPWIVNPTGGTKAKVETPDPAAPGGSEQGSGTDNAAIGPAADWWKDLGVDELNYVEIPVDEWDGVAIYDVAFRPYPDEPDARLAPFWTVLGLDDEVAALPVDATFVIYRDSCDHCAVHIQELAANDQSQRALVFVRIPEDGAPQDVVQLDQRYPEGTAHVSRLALPEGAPYVFTTPGDFQVDGGAVSAPREAIGL